MNPCLAVVIALAQTTAPVNDPASPCENWAFDGYTLGMSKEAALAIRKTKYDGFGSYKVKAKEGLLGYLAFEDEALWFWRRERELTRRDDFAVDQLVLNLKQRLGEPVYERMDKPDKSYMPLDREIAWHSTDCDAAVVLEVEYFFAVDSLDVNVHLVRLSMIEDYSEVDDEISRRLVKRAGQCTVEQIIEMHEIGLSVGQIKAACNGVEE